MDPVAPLMDYRLENMKLRLDSMLVKMLLANVSLFGLYFEINHGTMKDTHAKSLPLNFDSDLAAQMFSLETSVFLRVLR